MASSRKPLSKPAKLSKRTPNKAHSALFPFARRFIKRVQNTVKQFELWQQGDTFIVGVSGGPDSLCMLDVLATLQKNTLSRSTSLM